MRSAYDALSFVICYVIFYIEKRHTDKHDCLFTISCDATSVAQPKQRVRASEATVYDLTKCTFCTHIVLCGWHIRAFETRWYICVLFWSRDQMKETNRWSLFSLRCFDQLSVKCCSPEERQVYAWNDEYSQNECNRSQIRFGYLDMGWDKWDFVIPFC